MYSVHNTTLFITIVLSTLISIYHPFMDIWSAIASLKIRRQFKNVY